MKIPIFGTLLRMLAVSRFARTLATLLRSGVPLLKAMEIVKNVLDNAKLEKVIETAAGSIREGESIAGPLKRSGDFPPIVTHMIAVGEKSGQLEQMLENVARAYDSQVETAGAGAHQPARAAHDGRDGRRSRVHRVRDPDAAHPDERVRPAVRLR